MKNTLKIKTIAESFFSEIKDKECPASQASNEIMLNRVFNGNKTEFPFSK